MRWPRTQGITLETFFSLRFHSPPHFYRIPLLSRSLQNKHYTLITINIISSIDTNPYVSPKSIFPTTFCLISSKPDTFFLPTDTQPFIGKGWLLHSWSLAYVVTVFPFFFNYCACLPAFLFVSVNFSLVKTSFPFILSSVSVIQVYVVCSFGQRMTCLDAGVLHQNSFTG